MGGVMVSGTCEPDASLYGEISLAHQGMLFLGEIREISAIK
jgi:predicted ATPase with chaperone activity